MQLALNCDIQLSFRKKWILFVDLVSILLSFIYAHHKYFFCSFLMQRTQPCDFFVHPTLGSKAFSFIYRSKASVFHVQIHGSFFSCIDLVLLFFMYLSEASFFLYRFKVFFCVSVQGVLFYVQIQGFFFMYGSMASFFKYI